MRHATAVTLAGVCLAAASAPMTFMLDGRQFVVVGAGDSLYAFCAGPVTRGADAPGDFTGAREIGRCFLRSSDAHTRTS